MRKHLKKYLIPHEDNDYKPHILREASVAVIALVILVLFAVSVVHTGFLVRTKNFLASVVPSVLVDLTNDGRTEEELAPLSVSPALEEAARLKAEHMAELSYFAHVSPDGVTPWQWFVKAGYPFTYAGENLAVNFSDSAEVVDAWLDSPGHRENILNGNFTEIGIATSKGVYQGRQTVFVVQLFGRPAQAVAGAVAPSTAPPETEPSPEGSGSEEGSELALPPEVEVISETDLFLAVRNTEEGTEAVVDEGGEAAGAGAPGLVPQVSLFERLASEPQQLLNYVYMAIATIVLLALLLAIFIEIRKQHLRSVLYGVLLLVLIVVLVYINRTVMFSDLLIV